MTLTVNKKTYEAGELVAYVEKLEKENAELKKTVTKMNNVITKTFSNLTKAREIIRDLLSYLYSVEYDHVSDLEQAEQFLKEETE